MVAPVPAKPPPVRLFIGSSREGQEIAQYLQDLLESREVCEVDLWQHVFEPSSYTLPSLLTAAEAVDFAVLVATPDDTTVSRGAEQASVRDNIILEFGLFVGALGLDRTYLLSAGSDVKLPSDVLGLMRLPYRERTDHKVAQALNSAVLAIKRQVDAIGPRLRPADPSGDASVSLPERTVKARPSRINAGPAERAGRAPATNADRLRRALHAELKLLYDNAVAQGWVVKNNNKTTMRLESPKGRVFTLSKGTTSKTRTDLRTFADDLRKAGLRVNSALLRPEDESPFLD